MYIKSYYKLNELELNLFHDFILRAYNEKNQPAHVNMAPNNDNHALLYLLNNTSRYKDGKFNILFNDEQAIACSGCYVSDFSNHIAICGSRTWIDKKYRNKHISRDYLIPEEKKWATKNQIKCIALTFNDYNKNMIELWFRKRFGEKRNAREKRHFGFNNLHTLDFPVKINYTKQYIIFEILDKNFQYNWLEIKWRG